MTIRACILSIKGLILGISLGFTAFTYYSTYDYGAGNYNLECFGVCYESITVFGKSVTASCGWPVVFTVFCYLLMLSHFALARLLFKGNDEIYGPVRIGIGLASIILGAWGFGIVGDSGCSGSTTRFNFVAGYLIAACGVLGVFLGALFMKNAGKNVQ